MNEKARKRRMLLLSIVVSLGTSAAEARDDGGRPVGKSKPGWNAWTPIASPVTPQSDDAGSYGLRLRMRYLENVTGNVELFRHQYFVDDKLKTQWPRTSIAWLVRWYF